jgi:hypothetical protein
MPAMRCTLATLLRLDEIVSVAVPSLAQEAA